MEKSLKLSPLEQLPLEILQEIIGFLSSFPEALHSFSRVSSTCRTASDPYLFKKCVLRAGSRQRLLSDIEEAWEILSRRDRFRHVHHLRICTPWELPENPSEIDRIDNDNEQFQISRRREENCFSWEGDFEPGRRPARRYAQPANQNSRYGENLQKVVNLIDAMPALEHFEFDLDHRFPTILLNHLDKKPNCRLSLRDFKLIRPDHGLESYEIQLIKSPRLDSIEVYSTDKTPDGQWYYLQEAALQMSSGLCPHLHHVTINHSLLENNQHNQVIHPKPKWFGRLFAERSSEKGALRSLVMNCGHGGEEFISNWISAINCELLSRLRIYCVEQRLPEQDWLSGQQRNFRSLKDFGLTFSLSGPRDWEGHSETAKLRTEKIAEFLSTLHGLVCLKLQLFAVTEPLFAAIGTHSSTLRHLSLGYYYNSGFNADPYLVTLLQECTSLETVNLLFFSNFSQEEEHARDRERACAAISRLQKLEKLSLTIHDISRRTGNHPRRQDDHYAIAVSYWRDLVKFRGEHHPGLGWALLTFQCSVQSSDPIFKIMRHSFAFAGVDEELSRPAYVKPEPPRKKLLRRTVRPLIDIF